VDPVPDPLLLRKSGSTGNRTRTSGSVARNSDHWTTEAVSFLLYKIYKFSSYLTGNTIHLRSLARNSDHWITEVAYVYIHLNKNTFTQQLTTTKAVITFGFRSQDNFLDLNISHEMCLVKFCAVRNPLNFS
jgi:hypothetical protein